MLLDALIELAAILLRHHDYVLDITIDRSCIPAQQLLPQDETSSYAARGDVFHAGQQLISDNIREAPEPCFLWK